MPDRAPDPPRPSIQEARLGWGRPGRPLPPDAAQRLPGAYWRYLRRRFGGLIMVVDAGTEPAIVLLWRRLVLLRFGAPRFDSDAGLGRVTLPIAGGLLVARAGRGRGLLRFELREEQGGTRLRAVVDNYRPRLCGSGPLLRFRCWIYSQTQLRLHIHVTSGFLRSLSRGELQP